MKNIRQFVCINCKTDFKFKTPSNRHKFCNLECSRQHQSKLASELFDKRYNDWLSGKDLGLVNIRNLVRQFLTKRDGYKCAICSIDNWNNKSITLWVDHIDGNATNNLSNNFRLICPNCDSQSSTFGAKNTGETVEKQEVCDNTDKIMY